MPAPPLARLDWKRSCRIIPSRYPAVGLFDAVATPADVDAVIELESWTNDRINAELGVLSTVPPEQWTTGRPHASVVMAAFCHPKPGGARFSDEARGAWYAARSVETAIAESVYHRTKELAEIDWFETRVEMRLYHADFRESFHDIRRGARYAPLYDPDDYTASQRFAADLLAAGSNGIVYRSVRDAGGEGLACFRPRLVLNVRVAAHYEYRWDGDRRPIVRRLSGS